MYIGSSRPTLIKLQGPIRLLTPQRSTKQTGNVLSLAMYEYGNNLTKV